MGEKFTLGGTHRWEVDRALDWKIGPAKAT